MSFCNDNHKKTFHISTRKTVFSPEQSREKSKISCHNSSKLWNIITIALGTKITGSAHNFNWILREYFVIPSDVQTLITLYIKFGCNSIFMPIGQVNFCSASIDDNYDDTHLKFMPENCTRALMIRNNWYLIDTLWHEVAWYLNSSSISYICLVG